MYISIQTTGPKCRVGNEEKEKKSVQNTLGPLFVVSCSEPCVCSEAAMNDAAEILCAGIIVADHVSSPITHLPAAGELVLADQLLLTIGGCAANVAVDLVKLGVRARVVGRVGDDVFGRVVGEMLRGQ